MTTVAQFYKQRILELENEIEHCKSEIKKFQQVIEQEEKEHYENKQQLLF